MNINNLINMSMKRLLFVIAFLSTILNSMAQLSMNVVGTWDEKSNGQVVRTWIFNSDGTKTLKGSMKVTYPIGGINVTFDLIQERTDETWSISALSIPPTIKFTAIPLDNLKMKVNYNKYRKYTPSQQQRIKAALPAFIRQSKENAVSDWYRMVGVVSRYEIVGFSPKKLVMVDEYGEEYVLERNVSVMTPAERAAYNKEVNAYVEAANKLSSRTNKASNSSVSDDKVYNVVEQMPSFPGGDGAMMSWIKSHVQYPPEAREKGLQGRVLVKFVVEKDGSLSNIEVAKSVDPILDKEAVRVVKSMPKWHPGKNQGVALRVKGLVPVNITNN